MVEILIYVKKLKNMIKEFKFGKDIIPNPDSFDIEDFKKKILKRFTINLLGLCLSPWGSTREGSGL